MSPRDKALWLRFQRRANTLAPDLAKELLDAYRVIRQSLTDAELARLITSGQLDGIIDQALLDRSFVPLRDKVVAATKKGFQTAIPELPKQGLVRGQIGVAFDYLDPTVIEAIRQLDSRVINGLKDDIRDTVRAFIENGLREGKNPRVIARDLRSVIGLSPTQTRNAIKYEEKLRALKDAPSEDRITRMVDTYKRKAIRLNAETNARTATLDALKLGQKLSIDDAIAQGILDPARTMKTWIGVMDSRERPEHVAMQGETVRYNDTYSNGDDVPGESTYNCRCISRFTQQPAQAQAEAA